ncbi:MAG: hypothetical protein ACRC2J_13350 [Microcoleaceae cyanobacterium]
MNYLVAVLGDRIQAEAAYSALEADDLPMTQINILGRGYKTADEYGLIDPQEAARTQAIRMVVWLIPFGFFAGVGFSLSTGLNTFGWAGEIGNHVIGGLLASMGGAMGGLFVGGGVGLILGSGDAMPYRNRLNAGKYLIVVAGSEVLLRQATPILRKFRPENLQAYTTPDDNLRSPSKSVS